MSDTIDKTDVVDLLEVQGWLTGWGDFCNNRGTVGGHLGYQSPCAIIMRDNVEQQSASARPVLWNMDDQAYYTLIDRELAGMKQSGDKELMMWASLIRCYYLYGMPYRKLSKSVLSKYIHKDSGKICDVRRVKKHLAYAERHIYEAILELS